jgi:hypothetical protein
VEKQLEFLTLLLVVVKLIHVNRQALMTVSARTASTTPRRALRVVREWIETQIQTQVSINRKPVRQLQNGRQVKIAI